MEKEYRTEKQRNVGLKKGKVSGKMEDLEVNQEYKTMKGKSI